MQSCLLLLVLLPSSRSRHLLLLRLLLLVGGQGSGQLVALFTSPLRLWGLSHNDDSLDSKLAAVGSHV